MKTVESEKSRVELRSAIESLMFVWGEPLSVARIGKIIGEKPGFVEKLIEEMKVEYERDERGFQIIEVNKQYQFATRRENYSYIESLCKTTKSKGLSASALEVLTIIAYKQPITKIDIEQIRGVSSETAIQGLIERELIEVKGRLEKIGRPQVYGTTDMFLKSFGLASLKALPPLEGADELFGFKGEDHDDHI